jgi:hypothetical protein
MNNVGQFGVSVLERLPFASQRENGSVNLWDPAEPGEYSEACALGRRYAAELHEHMIVIENPMLLGAVVRAIIDRGKFCGVEAGFTGYFGAHMMGAPLSVIEN